MNTPTNLFRLFLRALLCSGAFLFLVFASDAKSGSATWNLNPPSNDWFNSANWTPATIPNGSSDNATFDLSNTTEVFARSSLFLNSLIFNPEASAFTINVVGSFDLAFFTFSGSGITNNSAAVQMFFVVSASEDSLGSNAVSFFNSASAGSRMEFTTEGGSPGFQVGGEIDFENTSSAGESTFINSPGEADPGSGGTTNFFDSSSASDATIISNGALVTGVSSGSTLFQDSSSAGSAHITCNTGAVTGATAGGVTFTGTSSAGNSTITVNGSTLSSTNPSVALFNETADAGSATIICNSGTNRGLGGLLQFWSGSSGGSARVELFGSGTMNLALHDPPGVTIGSIEGDGLVSLGTNVLTIGSNNLSATFSGIIRDTGSITKIGTGKLILTNANTYTGGTTVNGGTLLVNNSTGSGLGTGSVKALSGILGGSGTISGRVLMGTGHGTGATLAPGSNSIIPGTLAIGKRLAFKSDSFYRVTLNSNTPAADQVIANGIQIIGGQIVFNELGTATLPLGTTFTVMSNTNNKPFSGTFANLPDGGTVTVGSNTFQANYEGGDGNDLTLTVVQ